MIDEVQDSYDAMAKEYAAFALDDLNRVVGDQEWLTKFATLAALQDGVTIDLGCGPGHIANHLNERGLSVIGYDISKELIVEARRRFPASQFHKGDFTKLNIPRSSVGGIISRYSLIHILPTQLDSVFIEWQRMLEPGAPILLSFFAATSAKSHGTSFDHAVATAYTLFPATVVEQLQNTGFSKFQKVTRDPLNGERPLGHGTILAQKVSI